MPTPTVVAAYPFDPTGKAATNLISNEQQVLSPPASNGNWSDYFFIVPTAAPFFANSVVAYLEPDGRQLIEGADYICTHRFHDASLQCASPVYGSLTILDKTLSGVIKFSYQTVGGDWTLNATQIAQILANTLLDPRTTTWEQVVNLPYQFPPVDHQWDIVDMTGAADVVTALNNIVTALQNSGEQGLAQHEADYGNPHRVTAAQVGLGQVSNFPPATSGEAVTGTSNARYMTPATTTAAITAMAVNPLNAHTARTDNPHSVTKAQVGLASVNDFGWASTADAQGGVAVNGYMNAALTSAAITAQALTPLNAHTANTANPHNVTATQVGLGDVPNYPMATLNEAKAGTAQDRFMSPYLVAQVMAENLGGSLSAHLADYNNPHQVTASQVGLGNVQNYGIATNQDGIDGIATNLYMTPAATAAAINAKNATFDAHIANTSNPHNVTATQVGLGNVGNFGWASTQQAIDGIAVDGYMNAALVAAAINAQVGLTLSSHVADQGNPHNVTAAQVGAYTTAEVDTQISALQSGKLDTTAQAADSAKLEGKSLTEVVNQVKLSLPAAARYRYGPINPSVDGGGATINAGVTWTVIADVLPFTPDPNNPLCPLAFQLTGGEARSTMDPPVYRVMIDPRFPSNYICELLEGYGSEIDIGYTLDTGTNAFTMYVKSKPLRNTITLAVTSDPGNAFSDATTIFDVEPEGIVYLEAADKTIADRAALKLPGQMAFGPSPFVSGAQARQWDIDTVIQNVNVLDNGEAETAAQAAQLSWADSIPHFVRLASYGRESVRAAALTGWTYNPTTSKIQGSGGAPSVNALSQLVCNQLIPGDYQFEVLVDSTSGADYAIGLVAGYTDRAGQIKAIHALRDMGALTTDAAAAGGILGQSFYKLFSVGYNLFQDDAVDLGSTSTGLTWGDGVADSARAGTPYVPNSVTPGTNGWDGKGAVAIRVTVSTTGGTGGAPLMTLETSNYGAVAGSITYLTTVTIDFGAANLPEELDDLARAIQGEGLRWGFCYWKQPAVRFDPQVWPEKFLRYVTRSIDANGVDTSQLKIYNGTAWVSSTLAGSYLSKPGRLYVSNLNQRLYQSAQDGSLQPINVTGYNGTGQSVLTT